MRAASRGGVTRDERWRYPVTRNRSTSVAVAPVPVVIDAAQTAGLVPIHMPTMNIDVVCFTGHKSLFGPSGTGGMYICEHVDIEPCRAGGTGVMSALKNHPEAYPWRMEFGTVNTMGVAGLLALAALLTQTLTGIAALAALILVWLIQQRSRRLWFVVAGAGAVVLAMRQDDDDAAQAEAMAEALERMDYQVRVETSGQEALAARKRGKAPNGPPYTTFTVDTAAGLPPLTVRFDASATRDPDSDTVAYRWDFGDGDTADGATVTHRYVRLGKYRVILAARDQHGVPGRQPPGLPQSLPGE